MKKSAYAAPIATGFVIAFVGFASSFAVVLKGLTAVGASDAQAASGLMALSLAMGIATLLLAFAFKAPIVAAWSTPGGALLAATGAVNGGFPAAVGAFVVVGVLLAAAGLIKPFGRVVAAIPSSLANAMLAGILFGLCLQPIRALIEVPIPAAIVILTWLFVSRWKRAWATPAAAIIAAVIIGYSGGGGFDVSSWTPLLAFVTPAFSVEAVVSLALPLFIVTMVSQNLAGLAVLQAFGYQPKPRPLITTTGAFSFAAAPFGGHAVCLSSIIAAMAAAPDASPDPALRWVAAAASGLGSIVLGLLSSGITHFAAGSPILVEAVAGLALLSAFGSALHNALAAVSEREAALITFLVASSGVGVYGIGGAFWGLVAGGAVLAFTRFGALANGAK
jgi:benzoate membrane transport protein